MRKWKRRTAFCMAFSMTVSMPVYSLAASPEFARSAEEWEKLRDNVLEYDELEDLVHEYNTTVQNNHADYLKSDMRGKTSQEIADIYREAAEQLYASTPQMQESLVSEVMIDYNTSMLQAQARQAEKQADTNTTDGTMLKIQYDQAEATLASTAQTFMNTYYQLQAQLRLMQKNKELLTAVYDSTATRAGLGMATQAEVLTAKKNLQALEANLITIEGNIKNLRQKLCVMTGWSYDANPEIRQIPSADLTRIDGMNPEVDKQKAIENSYTLRNNKRKLENTSESTDVEIMQKTIREEEQKAASAVMSQHRAVLLAKSEYEQACAELELETSNMEIAERKFQMGAISKLEYLQQESALMEKQVGKEVKDMALFQAMETYDWTIKGLVNTSN